jgi:thiol-disulfide isomerase/thioredoxin
MKLKQLILIILLTGFLSCQNSKNKTIIIGKIVGEIPERLEYTVPINGINYFGFEDSVQPDSMGNFQINLDIDKPCFIEFSSGYKAYGTVIAEPEMSYSVFIDLDAKENAFSVKSENEKGQELYNKIANRSMIAGGHFELKSRNYLKDSVVAEIKQSIKNTHEAEIEGFRNLFQNKIISKDFFELVREDREYFYKGVQGSVAFINYLQTERGQNLLNRDEFSEMWKDIFQEKPVFDPELMRSPWFFYYTQNYLRYNELILDSMNTDSLAEMYKQGLIHTHTIENAKHYLSGPQLEYYFAAYIYYEAINKNYEKELIALFEQFKTEYPTSKFIQFLESEIIPIIAFHKKKEEPMNENIRFVDGSEDYNSFNEVLARFKDKRIFVDVWATWCGACKTEFKYNEELYNLLKENDVTLLYVSIDKQVREKQWKDMINYYNLEGYHLRANEKLSADLVNLYSGRGIAIPWHILIDEDGKIIVKHASGPSLLDKLKNELKNNGF